MTAMRRDEEVPDDEVSNDVHVMCTVLSDLLLDQSGD